MSACLLPLRQKPRVEVECCLTELLLLALRANPMKKNTPGSVLAFEGFEYSSRNIVFGCKANGFHPIVERTAIIGNGFPWDFIQRRKIPVNTARTALPASLYERRCACQIAPG